MDIKKIKKDHGRELLRKLSVPLQHALRNAYIFIIYAADKNEQKQLK